MVPEKDKREVPVRNIAQGPNDRERSVQRFAQSLLEAGVSIAMIPVNMLPPEPRKHLKAAGREATWGLASLTRKLAESLEKLAEEQDKKDG